MINKIIEKIVVGIIILTLAYFSFRFCEFKKPATESVEYNTNLIQQQILNVGKLVVTEGNFAEVITYKSQDKYLFDMLSFDKKALLIVNAEVTVAYDLHQIKYDIDQKTQTITIKNIPKEEIKINPDIKFYDVQQSQLNTFTAEDYNKINKMVKENLQKKIAVSSLKSNAQNRLVSELSKMLILTNTMGWKLIYNDKIITSQNDFISKIKG